MKPADIDKLINQAGLGWLNSEEKIRLVGVMKAVHNAAIDLSAGCVNDENIVVEAYNLAYNGRLSKSDGVMASKIKHRINALKLK